MKFKIIKVSKLRGGEPTYHMLLEGKTFAHSADSGSRVVYDGEFNESYESYDLKKKIAKKNSMVNCNICGNLISKYRMDVTSCGGMFIEDKIICDDCSRKIAMARIDE